MSEAEKLDVIKPADDEEAADFARVAGQVAAGEPEIGADWQGEAAPEAPKMDAAESMAGLLVIVSTMGALAGFKNAAALWTPETCSQAGALVVPVLRKYPWGARVLDFFETGAGVEELALGAFLVPMGIATWGAIKADSAPAEEKADQGGPESPVQALGTMQEVHGRANG